MNVRPALLPGVTDLLALLDEVEAFFGQPASVPERHVRPYPSGNGGGLRSLAEHLRAQYTSAGEPHTTNCCGVVAIDSVYDATPEAIIATLHKAKKAWNPGIFYATTGNNQVRTERALQRAGFQIAADAINPRYTVYSPGHRTRLWVIDANHLPEAPTP